MYTLEEEIEIKSANETQKLLFGNINHRTSNLDRHHQDKEITVANRQKLNVRNVLSVAGTTTSRESANHNMGASQIQSSKAARSGTEFKYCISM